MNKSGSQRRRGRHVGIYLNSEQYTRLQMAADQRRTTPGTLAKETVIAVDWNLPPLTTPRASPDLAAINETIERVLLPVPPQSLTEPPPPGFRCTFEDSGYRCALETGHGGIHISAQGYRLAAKKQRG